MGFFDLTRKKEQLEMDIRDGEQDLRDIELDKRESMLELQALKLKIAALHNNVKVCTELYSSAIQ